jgi:hypothetical protein
MLDEAPGRFACRLDVAHIAVDERQRIASLHQKHDLPCENSGLVELFCGELRGKPFFQGSLMSARGHTR